jgi:hypothetical protein
MTAQKLAYTATLSIAVSVFLVAVCNFNAISYTSGPPAGKTGSPGDNSNCTSCHTGTPQTLPGMITSNIPGTGYLSDSIYTITATIAVPNINKFGFQISPQNTAGQQEGTLIVTNSTETQLVGGTKYIEHKTAGTSGTGTKTWTFNWQAPAPNNGAVTFYGAFMATNNQANSSGDQCLLSSLTVQQDPLSGINTYFTDGTVSVFPVPFNESISVNIQKQITDGAITLFDISGKVVYVSSINSIINIDTQEFSSGMYLLNISGTEGAYTKKIVKL